MHPYDINYQMMSSQIKTLSEQDAIFKVISQAFYNTQSDSHTNNLQTEI